MLGKIMDRVKQLEEDVQKSLANHNWLLGCLNEAKNILNLVSEGANAIAPDAPVTEVIEEINSVVNEIDSLANGSSETEKAAV